MTKQKTPGSYLLTIRLKKALTIELHKKPLKLEKGWYCYAGSARAGLEGRLSRHLRTTEHKHWHIDHLLSNGTVTDLQLISSSDKSVECELFKLCTSEPGAQQITGFGATDCTCKSHLTLFRERPSLSIHRQCTRDKFSVIMNQFHRDYDEHASYEREPFETLVTCILSLRTRDPETFAASQSLFSALKTPEDFAASTPEKVADLISNVGLFRQKARHLVEIARLLLRGFGGQVPSGIDDLLTLPGVGRKTANLVRSFSFHLPAICVDTHVHRICNRMGLIRTADADSSEFALLDLLPEAYWLPLNPLMVQHGQQICKPHRPSCGICPVKPFCNYPALLEEDRIRQEITGAPLHPSLPKLPPPKDTASRGEKLLSPFEE